MGRPNRSRQPKAAARKSTAVPNPAAARDHASQAGGNRSDRNRAADQQAATGRGKLGALLLVAALGGAALAFAATRQWNAGRSTTTSTPSDLPRTPEQPSPSHPTQEPSPAQLMMGADPSKEFVQIGRASCRARG